MARSKKPKDFIKTPQYPGGRAALTKYVNSNLRYPKEALENKIEGEVEAEYFINGLGNITDVKILKGIGHGCDEEVIRLIKSLIFEKAVNRGLRTSTRKTLKVNFKLPNKKPQKVAYNLVSEKTEKEKPAQKKAGYSYTITIKK